MNSQAGGVPRRAVLFAVAALGLLSVPAAVGQPLAGAASPPENGGLPEVVVLSNRADLVSGGDALVQVVLPDASTRPPSGSVSAAGMSPLHSPSVRTAAMKGSSPGSPSGPTT
jgi:hypothetical protein